MTLPRIGPLVAASVLLGACAQLIGLNQFDANGGNGGDAGSAASGKGGKGGGGGSAGTGDGGKGGIANGSGAGGKAGSGTTSGTGGQAGRSAAGGTGGETGGAAGEAGTGANPSGGKGGGGGKGGSGTSGEGGAAGKPGCSETIEITVHGAPTSDIQATYTSYEYNVDCHPQSASCTVKQDGSSTIDTAAFDYLWIDFYTGAKYDGETVGKTFELGTGADDNYATCSRCVWFGVDVGDAGYANSYFYAKSGTLKIEADSDQMNGSPDVHLTDVLLSEVTLNSDTHVSHEIVGGRCLHLASADLVIKSNVPPEWTCGDAAYGTGDGCDCGCGVIDPDCSSALVGACEYCYGEGGCGDSTCANVKLTDNSQCVPSAQGWNCYPTNYGDGSICDCGCGVVDYDCASPTATCDYCDDPSSCTALGTGTCADIDPTDNSMCSP